jgi:hypothetical protein
MFHHDVDARQQRDVTLPTVATALTLSPSTSTTAWPASDYMRGVAE